MAKSAAVQRDSVHFMDHPSLSLSVTALTKQAIRWDLLLADLPHADRARALDIGRRVFLGAAGSAWDFII